MPMPPLGCTYVLLIFLQAKDKDQVRLLVKQIAGGKHSVRVRVPSEVPQVLNTQGSPQVGLSLNDPPLCLARKATELLTADDRTQPHT